MDKDFVASISYLPAHMLTDELERLKSFTQIFFNPNAFQYGVSAGQDYSNTKKSMTHPSCHLSSGRHVINGIFSQDSEFDILEDGLVSVRVDYDFNYDDISASQKFYSLSIGLYESNTNFQEGNGHQKITFSSHMEIILISVIQFQFVKSVVL
ncbi:hypothetical protein S245_010246 [Arachis hypogaea]